MRPTRLSTLVALLLVTGAVSWGALSIAESRGTLLPPLPWAAPLGIAPMMLASDETAVRRAFQDVLKREPTGRELRRYRTPSGRASTPWGSASRCRRCPGRRPWASRCSPRQWRCPPPPCAAG